MDPVLRTGMCVCSVNPPVNDSWQWKEGREACGEWGLRPGLTLAALVRKLLSYSPYASFIHWLTGGGSRLRILGLRDKRLFKDKYPCGFWAYKSKMLSCTAIIHVWMHVWIKTMLTMWKWSKGSSTAYYFCCGRTECLLWLEAVIE